MVQTLISTAAHEFSERRLHYCVFSLHSGVHFRADMLADRQDDVQQIQPDRQPPWYHRRGGRAHDT